MRIELDLPDWVDERNMRIFAGIELVASKISTDDFWKVKDDRCVQCGKCCTDLKPDHFCPSINGECIYLEPEKGGKRLCKVAIDRPRSCQEDPQRLIKTGECSITYKICR